MTLSAYTYSYIFYNYLHIYINIFIYQHMPMGAKTAPLRQRLRSGTRLISWLLSSHFWLFHLHTSCFPSGAIKAVIVCRSLPSAAWQRLMLMMTSGMMASNTDPLEWAVQLLVCRLKNKHYQSHRCHRIISNIFQSGSLLPPWCASNAEAQASD